MALAEEKLHMSLSLVFLSMCEITGISKGKKNDLSPVSMAIIRGCMLEKLKIGDIARMNGISYGTATKCVINLEKKGFVRREKGDDDGRTVYVLPAEKAFRRVEGIETLMHGYVAAGMSRLQPDKQELFIDLLAEFSGYGEGQPADRLVEAALKPAEKSSKRQAKKR